MKNIDLVKKKVIKLNSKQLTAILDNYYMPTQLSGFIKSLLIKKMEK